MSKRWKKKISSLFFSIVKLYFSKVNDVQLKIFRFFTFFKMDNRERNNLMWCNIIPVPFSLDCQTVQVRRVSCLSAAGVTAPRGVVNGLVPMNV